MKLLVRADRDKLLEVSNVKLWLTTVVKNIGMRSLGDPVCYDVPLQLKKMGVDPYQDEGGCTGLIALSTSHAAIHTWPLQKRAVADVYSCREFDPEYVISITKGVFRTDEVQWTDLTFALKRPRQSTKMVAIAQTVANQVLAKLEHLQPGSDCCRLMKYELFGSGGWGG